MDTMLAPGTSSASGEAEFELRIVDSERAILFRDVLESMLQGMRPLNGPVLFSLDQALELVRQDRMQLWIARKEGDSWPCLFFLTEIDRYPAGNIVRICLIRGRHLRQIMTLFREKFLLWARMQDALYLEADVAPGLVRILKPHGFIPTSMRVHLPLVTLN